MLLLSVAAFYLCLLTCRTKSLVTAECKIESKLEVLPGRGWDNLRNKEMGQVLALIYDTCKITKDGLYLLPDHVSVIPIKKSDMALTSEIIEHYTNYSSITSKSFKAEASGSFFGSLSVSGSFSAEYETVRQNQVDDKSATTRVHLRNTIYSVLAEPFAEIDPDLKKLVMNIAHEIEKNNTDRAEFLLELIVRDYGTHYVSHIDAGAILAREDFLMNKFMSSFSGDKSKISAAASASFLETFKFDASYTESVDKQLYKSFKDSCTSSYVRVNGGSLLEPNLSVHNWVAKIPHNLVATDRSGEPLSYIITPMKFPHVSLNILGRLRLMLESAIRAYYSYNTHVGCMSMDSPNFEFNANVDDHSCQSPYNNYTFGGVYQTCSFVDDLWYLEHYDLCNSTLQMNPLTGKQTCPPGYTAVPLLSIRNHVVSCVKFLFWWECAVIQYDSFWCAATEPVATNHGVMFGGVYSDTTNNPVTRSQSCPFTYFPLRIGTHLKVCVSNDYELGFKYSVPFGGFFSCSHGNPLAKTSTGKNFYGNSNNPYPHGCPGGYSQHMALIDKNCEINYCVQANAFSQHGQIPIIRPPFKDISSLYVDKMALLSLSSTDTSIPSGSVAGIVIGSLIALTVVVLGVVWWRKQRRAQQYRSSEQDPLVAERPQYESVSEPTQPNMDHSHSTILVQTDSSAV